MQREFRSVMTRRRYCETVGIHPTTLRRWESEGILAPSSTRVMNLRTNVFSSEDVAFGKKLIALLRKRPGELSLAQAAELIRRTPGH